MHSALHSHATGQTERCFAIKPSFMSTPSRCRLRPFLGRQLHLELRVLAPLRVDFKLISLLLSVAGEGLFQIGYELLDPIAQDILTNV